MESDSDGVNRTKITTSIVFCKFSCGLWDVVGVEDYRIEITNGVRIDRKDSNAVHEEVDLILVQQAILVVRNSSNNISKLLTGKLLLLESLLELKMQ